ncbi:hypothetical protein Esti_004794 [Eimeria stiedai]
MGPEFASLARSLQHLLKQTASFQRTGAHSSPAHSLEDRLIHYTKLSLCDLTKPFILRTDPSCVAIGAVLEQDGKPLGFLSNASLMPECAIQRTISSSQSCVPSNVGGISLIAAEHLNIVCQPGAANVVADALSRCPLYEQDTQHALSKVLSVPFLPPAAPQQSCLSASNPPEPAVRASLLLVGRRPRLQIESNINSGPSHKSPSLLFHDNVQASPQPSLSDPAMQGVGDDAWERILYQHHDLFTAGHLGISKTYNQIAMFYWKGIREWSSISLDFIGGLPLSSDGYGTILTAMDNLSKMAHFIPTKTSLSAADFVRLFADRVVRYHGLPTTIVSDRDPRFVSGIWLLFCLHIGIKRALSRAWHPQTNCQTGRANRTIEQMLRSYIQNRAEEWADLLPTLELAYDCTSHSATGLSPFEVMGENSLRPQDLDLVDVFPPTFMRPMTKTFRILVD